MKKTLTVLIVILIGLGSAMISCTSKKTSIKELEQKNGLYFKKGSDKPFTGEIVTKYASGVDSLKMNIKEGKLDGAYLTFYNSGKICDSIIYAMGVSKSTKSYTEDGKLKCDCNEISFNRNKGRWITLNDEKIFDGECVSYWDNKNKMKVYKIVTGKRRELDEWFKNGNMQLIKKFDENGKDKYKEQGYENGKMALRYEYNDGNLSKAEEWYENGQKKLVHILTSDVGNEHYASSLDGWYEDGKDAYHFTSNKGKPICISVFDDAQSSLEGVLSNVRFFLNAKGKAYYKNGEWKAEAFYEGEKEIKIQNETKKVSVVDKGTHIMLAKSNEPFINHISFYNGSDIVIMEENKTLEEAVNWHNNYWHHNGYHEPDNGGY